MKKQALVFITCCGMFAITTIQTFAQVNINFTAQINGFRHNWDCGNDGAGNDPDPRYMVWIGWDGANFVQTTGGPQIPSCAGLGVYGADQVVCSNYNPGVFSAGTFFNVPANNINVDMKSWEDD